MRDCFVISTAVFLSMIPFAILAFFVFRNYRMQRAETRSDFKIALLQRLRKHGNPGFDVDGFARECEVSRAIVTEVCEEIFGQVCAKAVEDGEISSEERAKLDRMAQTLCLEQGRAQVIEDRLKGQHYRAAVENALADGKITPEEEQELKQLRRNFGLSRISAFELSPEPAKEGYLALFRSIVRLQTQSGWNWNVIAVPWQFRRRKPMIWYGPRQRGSIR